MTDTLDLDPDEDERERVAEAVHVETSEVVQEVEVVLPDLLRRLDALSADLRSRGAFPVASQIDRNRDERGSLSHG